MHVQIPKFMMQFFTRFQRTNGSMVQCHGSMVYFIQSSQKSYNNKYNIKHMKEKMLDEDPAKREAWSAEARP